MSSVIVLLIKRQCVHVALSSWSVRSTLVVNVAAMIMIADEVCCNALGESHCETALWQFSNENIEERRAEKREERRRRECECEVRVRVCSSQCVQRCVCVCAWSVEAVIGVCLVFGVDVCGCGVCCV